MVILVCERSILITIVNDLYRNRIKSYRLLLCLSECVIQIRFNRKHKLQNKYNIKRQATNDKIYCTFHTVSNTKFRISQPILKALHLSQSL